MPVQRFRSLILAFTLAVAGRATAQASPTPCQELFRAERARLAPQAEEAQAEMERDERRWRELNRERRASARALGTAGATAGAAAGVAVASEEGPTTDRGAIARGMFGMAVGATLGALTGGEIGRRWADRRHRRERGEIQERMRKNYSLIEVHGWAREAVALVEAARHLRAVDANETDTDPRRLRQETERLLAYSTRKPAPAQDRLAVAQTLARDLLELDAAGSLCRGGRVPSGRELMRRVEGI